jgi:hypothetical protein
MLENKISIYIPTTEDISEENLKLGEYFKNFTLKEFSKLHGGATAIESEGAYIDNKGNLIIEKVYIVFAFVKELDSYTIRSTEDIGRHIQEKMKQETILVQFNNKVKFL